MLAEQTAKTRSKGRRVTLLLEGDVSELIVLRAGEGASAEPGVQVDACILTDKPRAGLDLVTAAADGPDLHRLGWRVLREELGTPRQAVFVSPAFWQRHGRALWPELGPTAVYVCRQGRQHFEPGGRRRLSAHRGGAIGLARPCAPARPGRPPYSAGHPTAAGLGGVAPRSQRSGLHTSGWRGTGSTGQRVAHTQRAARTGAYRGLPRHRTGPCRVWLALPQPPPASRLRAPPSLAALAPPAHGRAAGPTARLSTRVHPADLPGR